MTKLTHQEMEKVEGGAEAGAFFEGIAKLIEAPFTGLVNLIGAVNTTILSGKEHDNSSDMSYKIGDNTFDVKHNDAHSSMTNDQLNHMYSDISSFV